MKEENDRNADGVIILSLLL